MVITRKTSNTKYWQGCGEVGCLIYCWWECKIVQLFWKIVCLPQKVKCRIIIWPKNSTLRCISAQFSSVAQSCLTMRAHESQHARPRCPSPAPRVHSDSRPSSQWCHPAISSSSSPSPPAPNPSQHQSLFQWVNPLHEVAKVLEFQL